MIEPELFRSELLALENIVLIVSLLLPCLVPLLIYSPIFHASTCPEPIRLRFTAEEIQTTLYIISPSRYVVSPTFVSASLKHASRSQLSRRLNTVNPNDTLAKRVIDIARHNRSGDAFVKAASSFGKFDSDFLLGIHSQILAYLAAESSEGSGSRARRASHGSTDPAVENRSNLHIGQDERDVDDGMVHGKADVQPGSDGKKGGLFRTGEVRPSGQHLFTNGCVDSFRRLVEPYF